MLVLTLGVSLGEIFLIYQNGIYHSGFSGYVVSLTGGITPNANSVSFTKTLKQGNLPKDLPHNKGC